MCQWKPPANLEFLKLKKFLDVLGFKSHKEKWENISAQDSEPFYRIESLNGVLVLALTNDGEIILVRQFRHAIRTTDP